jgi:predicted RNA-binding protein with PUA-like domain
MNPISLAQIKAEANLSEMLLVRQSRLSVMPVTDAEWNQILRMSQEEAESGG